MRLLWWRQPKNARRDEAPEGLTDLSPKRPGPYAARMRRIRNGQDVEFEQLTAHLRNKHF